MKTPRLKRTGPIQRNIKAVGKADDECVWPINDLVNGLSNLSSTSIKTSVEDQMTTIQLTTSDDMFKSFLLLQYGHLIDKKFVHRKIPDDSNLPIKTVVELLKFPSENVGNVLKESSDAWGGRQVVRIKNDFKTLLQE